MDNAKNCNNLGIFLILLLFVIKCTPEIKDESRSKVVQGKPTNHIAIISKTDSVEKLASTVWDNLHQGFPFANLKLELADIPDEVLRDISNFYFLKVAITFTIDGIPVEGCFLVQPVNDMAEYITEEMEIYFVGLSEDPINYSVTGPFTIAADITQGYSYFK